MYVLLFLKRAIKIKLYLFQACCLVRQSYFRQQKKGMKRLFFIVALATALTGAVTANGQNMHVSANLLDYLNLGTINGEFGLSPSPNWTFYIRGRYNPFTFKFQRQIQNRVAGVATGARYWFWYSNTGWFLDTNVGYMRYNTGGIVDKYAYEGDAYGAGLGAGYAFMLSSKWNLNVGLGVQGGYTSYTKYACPKCGKVIGKMKGGYLVPSNIMVQILRVL